ncbi:MAG: hypothetical protein GX236_11865 [Clostridiaceae bacterium]|jgi:MinD-like ATPase involved in chromosome partitioning or flagellar assembly|nr:hypothetical protein [Clostridiaceae bacterium]
MQISFWSNMHGQGATSVTTAAVASAIAQKTALKTLVVHNQIERSALEGYLFKESGHTAHNIRSLSNQGIDALFRLMKNGRLKSEKIADYTYSILKNHRLDLLLGTEKKQRMALEDQELFLNILSCSKDFYDLIIIDVHSGIKENNSLKILKSSDIIVFCINQNSLLLGDLAAIFDEYDFLRQKRAVYVLSRYEKNSSKTIGSIARQYGIKKDLIFEIPNSPQLLDALNAGRVYEYIAFNQTTRHYEEKQIISSLNRMCEYIVEGCEKNCH